MWFNETYYRKDKNLLDLNNDKIIFRNAVRAIIIKDNKILMAHLEKTDEYKFPGGGKEENETPEDALKREVLEEVGYKVKKIEGIIGTVTEFDIAKEGMNNTFKMVSEYYLAEVDDKPAGQNLEDYEKELLFKPCWVEIEKAYKINKEKIENENREKTGGINRETIVLEIIKEKYQNHKK
jgi:8-oxo-dGTP pyrophosphatase MutT (NUDIX family)